MVSVKVFPGFATVATAVPADALTGAVPPTERRSTTALRDACAGFLQVSVTRLSVTAAANADTGPGAVRTLSAALEE